MDKRRNIPFARNLRHQSTDAELALWQVLRARQLAGLKFRRQAPIGAYVVDFLCIEAKLIIEIDGGQHLDQQSYDEVRTRFLVSHGFVVLRFWNDEVLCSLEAVLEHILRTVRPSHPHPNPLPARAHARAFVGVSCDSAQLTKAPPHPPAGEGA